MTRRARFQFGHSGFDINSISVIRISSFQPQSFRGVKRFTYLERTYILQALCRLVLQKEAEETLFVRRRGMARL